MSAGHTESRPREEPGVNKEKPSPIEIARGMGVLLGPSLLRAFPRRERQGVHLLPRRGLASHARTRRGKRGRGRRRGHRGHARPTPPRLASRGAHDPQGASPRALLRRNPDRRGQVRRPASPGLRTGLEGDNTSVERPRKRGRRTLHLPILKPRSRSSDGSPNPQETDTPGTRHRESYPCVNVRGKRRQACRSRSTPGLSRS
jgi:hypothetical protein